MLHFLQSSVNYNFQFDSRKCNENSIFFALETGNRSGTDFAHDAIKNGVKVVISQKGIDGMNSINIDNFHEIIPNLNIVVPDVLFFMQELAKQKFLLLKNKGIKTICLTGSVGKTTTKELIASTLAGYGKIYATQGNYNNHIGVPLTILNAPTEIDFLVLEMGMNHEGEISTLASIAPCEFSLITNIKENHAGNFSNGISGVRRAKFEILETYGKCFILKEFFEEFTKDELLMQKYGTKNLVCIDVQVKDFHSQNNQTSFVFENRTFCLNEIYSNAQIQMFCLAIKLMDTVLAKKISKIVLPQIKGRGNIVNWHGIRVVNESYNASPASMKNALENFKKLEGRKLCILGEMRELGDMSLEFHKNLKPYLQNFDGMILVGKNFESIDIFSVKHFENYASCLEFLKSNIPMLKEYDNILVKASNGVLLWKLFDEFFI